MGIKSQGTAGPHQRRCFHRIVSFGPYNILTEELLQLPVQVSRPETSVAQLQEGQSRLETRMDNLEAGQEELKGRMDNLEDGQKHLEAGQDELKGRKQHRRTVGRRRRPRL